MKYVKSHSSFIIYLIVMLFISLIDGAAGAQINLWILYCFPIGLATWSLGRAPGFVLSAMAVVLLWVSALIWGHPYASLKYLAIAYFSKGIAYFVLVGLVGALRTQQIERVFTPLKFRD